MTTKLDKRIERIECRLWNLEAELVNSGLFFKGCAVFKAVHEAGSALYKYRQSRDAVTGGK